MKRILVGFLLILPLVVLGKSYYYTEIRTEIHFTPDGNARIIQERTYSFEGSFSWAFVDLKKQGAENIVFNELSEQTSDGWQKIEPVELNDSPKSLYIRWGYSAQDEAKTFKLDYTVIGAVKRYEDVAEFYWKIIEDEHEPITTVYIDLNLPEPSPNLFKVYIHSRAEPGTLNFNDAKDQATIEQENIPRDAFVEVRMFTSPESFSGVQTQPKKRYQEFLNQEKRNFVFSTIRKFIFIPLGLLLMIVLPIIILLVFYFRYGREPKIDYQAIYEHEPPRPAPPIVVPAILHQKPAKSAMYQPMFQGMFATLLNLAVKGLVSVKEIGKGHSKHYEFTLEKPEKVSTLDSFSQTVVDFFFNQTSDNPNSFTDETLKKYTTAHPIEIRSALGDLLDRSILWWQKELGGDLLDLHSSNAYNTFFLYLIPAIAVGAFLLGSGLRALFSVPGPVYFVIPMFIGIFLIVIFAAIGRAILRWSPTAYLEKKRWSNFRKFLTDFSAIEQAPITLLPIWEQYFVYATVLGVAKKFLKNIGELASKQGTAIVLPVWYTASTTTQGAGLVSFAEGMSSFESFASNFSSMVDSFSASSSSGGGFSGGGGGGGGGGSSGAG
jgi:uncharacterized membrane protein